MLKPKYMPFVYMDPQGLQSAKKNAKAATTVGNLMFPEHTPSSHKRCLLQDTCFVAAGYSCRYLSDPMCVCVCVFVCVCACVCVLFRWVNLKGFNFKLNFHSETASDLFIDKDLFLKKNGFCNFSLLGNGSV